VNQICEILDVKSPRADKKSYKEQIAFVVDRLGHDRRYAIDDSHAQAEIGFTRNYSFNEGLRETIDWYMKNQEWRKSVLSKGALK
jgi:dTDP-glucose 4,6-dehydratase